MQKSCTATGEDEIERRESKLGSQEAGRGVSAMGMLVLVAGCHAGGQSGDRTLLERISRAGHSKAVSEAWGACGKGPGGDYGRSARSNPIETASKGLIVSETGLHEDVFMLRDRVSYGAIGYGLDEALRLESLLRAEAKVARASGRTGGLHSRSLRNTWSR